MPPTNTQESQQPKPMGLNFWWSRMKVRNTIFAFIVGGGYVLYRDGFSLFSAIFIALLFVSGAIFISFTYWWDSRALGIGKSGSRAWIWISVIVIVLAAALIYFLPTLLTTFLPITPIPATQS